LDSKWDNKTEYHPTFYHHINAESAKEQQSIRRGVGHKLHISNAKKKALYIQRQTDEYGTK
jgi:hypothetical protein